MDCYGTHNLDEKLVSRQVDDDRQLSAEEEAMIQRLIRDRTPDQLKLGFALWNRQPVAQLVQAQLGVQLPVRTVGHYLKRWGFTPQQPIKKAQEPRPAEVQRWLEETYPRIARRAKTEGAEIHWGDEAGLCSDDVRDRGCAPKGQMPIVRTNNKRESLRIISTVTNQGKVRWKMFEGAMHADLLIDFSQAADQGRRPQGVPDPG